MIFFSKLKLRHKIALLPVVSLCGFLIFLGYSINSNIQNEKRIVQIGQQDYPVLDKVNQSWVLLLEIEAIFSNAISDQDKYLLKEANEQAETLIGLFDEINSISPAYVKEVTNIKSAFQKYFLTATELAASISNETSLVGSIDLKQIQKMHKQYLLFKNLQQKFKSKIEKIFSLKLKILINNAENSNKLGILIAVLLIIILIIISLLISLLITRPLKHVSAAATDIMNGKWEGENQNLSYESNDEISELTHAFSLMQSKIKMTITDLEIARDLAISEGKANKEKSIFISNISHELRTPMHAILSFGNLGISRIDKVDSEKIVTYFQHITKSADRLLHLINNLLELANLESNKTELKLVLTDLSELLEIAIFEQQDKIDKNNSSISVKVTTDNSQVQLDSNLITQVINNILDNALKFSEPNKKIEITIFESENNSQRSICMSIKDEGVGIPEKELLDIFDSFSQSSRTMTGAGGTGLGLSISKSIIELHDGEIWAAQNDDNQGVTISFSLPVGDKKIEN